MWKLVHATNGPNSTRVVVAAMAAISVQASHGPRGGPVLPAVQQVLAEPDGVEPEVLDGPDHVEELRPADLALDLGELDADLERPSRHQPPAATAAAIARRWSGVLPQQPPTMVAPASRISSTWPAIVSGSAR